MDAFEEIVAGLYRRQGFWTWQNYKIDLDREEKRNIGQHSMPRPEIDILAYRPASDELLWIECKSYLDSPGVKISPVEGNSDKKLIGIRVFDDDGFRTIASAKLLLQTYKTGLTLEKPSIKYCLVAGNIHRNTESILKDYFAQNQGNGWVLHDREWVRNELRNLADIGYENDIATFVVKLLNEQKVKKNAD